MVAKREDGRGAGCRREIERAGFLRHGGVEMDVGVARQRRVRPAGDGDQLGALTLDRGQDVENLHALAGVGDGDHHVVGRDHPEVAVTGFGRMHEEGWRSRAGQRRGDLAPDVAGLADAADDDAAAAGEDQADGVEEGAVEALAEGQDGVGLDAQHLARQIEGLRGGLDLVHGRLAVMIGRKYSRSPTCAGPAAGRCL